MVKGNLGNDEVDVRVFLEGLAVFPFSCTPSSIFLGLGFVSTGAGRVGASLEPFGLCFVVEVDWNRLRIIFPILLRSFELEAVRGKGVMEVEGGKGVMLFMFSLELTVLWVAVLSIGGSS